MEALKRKILVTTDIDGVQKDAPVPVNTALSLIFRRLHIPEPDEPNGIYAPHGLVQKIWTTYQIRSHHNRPAMPEGLAILHGMKRIAGDNERDIRFAALSGREPDKHQFTREELSGPEYIKLALEFLLNEGTSGARWKGANWLCLLSLGFSMVDLEDDVKAALTKEKALARFRGDPNGVIYLKRNISNHPWLLQHGQITLPERVIPYNNHGEVLRDFERRLHEEL